MRATLPFALDQQSPHATLYYMRSILSLSLPKRLARDLTRAARELRVPRSFLVRQAVERFLLEREFAGLSSRLRRHALRRGVVSDEDVFDIVS